MVGSARPFAATSLLQPSAPMPVSAVLDQNAGTFTITFDQQIEDPLPAAVDAGLRIANTRLTYLDWAVAGSGDAIVGSLADASADAGANMAFMNVPPTGVRSLSGEVADAFSGFPLTVI